MNKHLSEHWKEVWARKTPEERTEIAAKRARAIWDKASPERKREKAAQLTAGRRAKARSATG